MPRCPSPGVSSPDAKLYSPNTRIRRRSGEMVRPTSPVTCPRGDVVGAERAALNRRFDVVVGQRRKLSGQAHAGRRRRQVAERAGFGP